MPPEKLQISVAQQQWMLDYHKEPLDYLNSIQK